MCSRPYRAKKILPQQHVSRIAPVGVSLPKGDPMRMSRFGPSWDGPPPGGWGVLSHSLCSQNQFQTKPQHFSAGLAERALFLCPNAVPTFLHFIWGASIQRQGSVFRPAPLPLGGGRGGKVVSWRRRECWDSIVKIVKRIVIIFKFLTHSLTQQIADLIHRPDTTGMFVLI